MSYVVKILPVAREDIKETIKWYNKKDLGIHFIQMLKIKLLLLRRIPFTIKFFTNMYVMLRWKVSHM